MMNNVRLEDLKERIREDFTHQYNRFHSQFEIFCRTVSCWEDYLDKCSQRLEIVSEFARMNDKIACIENQK